MRDLEEHELAEERRALVTGSSSRRSLEHERGRKAPLQRYAFPPQELDARKGDEVYDSQGRKVGTVAARQPADRTIDIKKTKKAANDHPHAVFFHNRVPSDALRKSLMRLGEAVLANGFETGDPWRAAIELLLRRSPPRRRGRSGRLQRPDETTVEAACRIALELDGNVLAIQGPPGTGKTYTGAHVICALVRAGLKVGVTAVSHKVIVNVLEGGRAAGARAGAHGAAIVHRNDGDVRRASGASTRTEDYATFVRGSRTSAINVVGGTAWCWARPDFEQSVDVLIVDEAGQMSLANVLATAQAARNLVLLGDPQQLEQPLQSSHPEGSEVSALYHVLDGEAHDSGGQGPVPRGDPASASGDREVHVRGLLRRQGRVAAGTGAPSDPHCERWCVMTQRSPMCAGSGLALCARPTHRQSRAVGGGGRDHPRARQRSPVEPVQLARQARCGATA